MLKVLILNIFLFFHPVHVTLTTINQVQDSDTLKVFLRMYYDDFQRDYILHYPEFKPGKNNDTTGISREMLNKYFNDRVQIYVNHKLLSGKLSDVSIDSYEICLNLIYHSDIKPRNFRIRNQILTSIYSDQANMVYLNINKYEDAIKLTVDHIEETISLK
ncbi:MAG: DUF6702 family protein [Bacteroidales bacterium]